MTTTDRPVSDERAAEKREYIKTINSQATHIATQAEQIAALVAERDALRAKLGTVLLCANCGAAAVAATAEQGNP